MSDYPALSHLLGSYLHQDFADEFPSAMDAVRAFAAGEPPDSVRSAASEIGALLQDDWYRKSPDSALSALGCYYDPKSEGLSPSDWLKQLQGVLRGD